VENTVAVHARSLSAIRGGVTVLTGIDIDVPAGQVVGLLGPSGSGKTTIMRAIVGVQANVTGTLTVLGEPAGSPSLRRRIGYGTQAASVYTDLSVVENLLHFAALAGLRGSAAKAAAAQAVMTVGLSGHEKQQVGSLSGGERSRVSLAAALVGDPALLVLDEPTVGLDPVLRRELWTTFHDLAAQGRTLLVSSHVMDEASRCDRLLLLRQGKLLADTTPADLLATTGQADAELAFLALIDRANAAATEGGTQ
jgi:ABC-2 type transport system ATP-binding protein